MKTITLEKSKETHIVRGVSTELEFNDKSLIKEVINIPPREGITVEQMSQRIKLLDKVEAAQETLELEDADFTAIKELIQNYRFGIVSKHVLKLCEKFTEAK